ncbi:MAG: hypothetical protein K2M46_14475 [Lachnospiraceae bacterium]|nr:hypothetical protein [Lachnospiraceae bacterium]
MRFEAIKDVPREVERWEESEAIPKGAICETTIFGRVETITYKGKLICDADSQMAKDYFKQIA